MKKIIKNSGVCRKKGVLSKIQNRVDWSVCGRLLREKHVEGRPHRRKAPRADRPRKTSALCFERRSRFYKPNKMETNLFFIEFVYSLNSVLSYFGTELFKFRVISFLLVDPIISLIAYFVKDTFTKGHFFTKWPYNNIAKV